MFRSVNREEKKSIYSLSSLFGLRMIGLFMILPVFSVYAGHLSGSTPIWIGLKMFFAVLWYSATRCSNSAIHDTSSFGPRGFPSFIRWMSVRRTPAHLALFGWQAILICLHDSHALKPSCVPSGLLTMLPDCCVRSMYQNKCPEPFSTFLVFQLY